MATIKLTNNVKISEDSLETPKVYTVTKTNVTVGGRSDGSCTWYKHGNWVTMESRLIGSGAKTYTLSNFIPEGYRPAYEVRTGINGVASGAVNMYGHVQLSTDGTVIIFSSGTGATEPIFSITYWTSQSESGGSGGSSGGGSSGGGSGGSGGPSGWGFNSVLLWENPTPTASFGARTLDLDLSEYSHVQIVFLRVYNDSPPVYITNMYLVDGLKILESVNTGSNYNLSRTFFVNTNSIVFEDGYCSNSGITGSNVLIPYQIYGYNGDFDGSINYTTTEQRIGTWTDGLPLYRKVILDTYTQNTGNARNLNISGVYQYIKVEVNFIPLATSATNSVSTTPYYYSSSDYLYYYLSTPATGQLTIKGGSDWPKTSPIAIIVTYTKQS